MPRCLHAGSCKIAKKWGEVQKLFLHQLKGCRKFVVYMHVPSTAFDLHASSTAFDLHASLSEMFRHANLSSYLAQTS